ncbi:MAG: DsbA family protein [Phycisphaerales bacterium]
MATPVKSAAPSPESRGTLRAVGTLALVVAVVACSFMVLHHFGAMQMPGCGIGSPCDAAAKSVWGKVPGIGYPTSFVGFAYFFAMLIAWPMTRGRTPGPMHAVILLGALASLGFVGIAIAEKLPCIYCFVAHGANFVFVGAATVARRGRDPIRGWQPLLALSVFLIATGTLAAANASASEAAKKKADAELKASIAKMTKPGPEKPTPPTTPNPEPGPVTQPKTTQPQPEPTQPTTPNQPDPTERNPLAGRYRLGPEQAAVRVVMWIGYQCEDCQRLEKELMELRKDASLSMSVVIKHFPLNTDCNPNAPGRHHGNACWAARAAEAAGILGGPDAFWAMHDWLFDRRGDFSNAQMDAQATSMGFAPRDLTQLMNNPSTLAPITTDVDDAMKLGIYQTPFVFINGVELRGWNAPQALTRAVRAVAATSPAPAATDTAPDAGAKFVADWRAMPRQTPPTEFAALAVGPADAEVEVVVWGDYSEPGTAEVDGMFRLFLGPQKPNIRYTFLQFPVDKSCNASIQISKYPQSCRPARAAKAAEILAGPDGFWKMHERIILNQNNLTDAMLEGMALELGIAPADLMEAINIPDAQRMVNAEAAAAMKYGVTSIPFVLVNGKQLTRWKAGYENVIPRIITAAAEDRAAGK